MIIMWIIMYENNNVKIKKIENDENNNNNVK